VIFRLHLQVARSPKTLVGLISTGLYDVGQDSSVAIATRYRLDGPGSNPGKARFSAPLHAGPGAHPASYTMGTGSLFPGVKRPGRDVDHPSHLAPRLRKSRAISLFPTWIFVACYRVNCTFTFTYMTSYLIRKHSKFRARLLYMRLVQLEEDVHHTHRSSKF